MQYKLVFLPTDVLIYLLVIAIIIIFWASRRPDFRIPWQQVTHKRIGMISLVILMSYVLIGLLDSIHFRTALSGNQNPQKIFYSIEVKSLLDILIRPLGEQDESSYSAPFATQLYTKQWAESPDHQQILTYPRLQYGGKDLTQISEKSKDIVQRSLQGFFYGIIIWLIISLLIIFYLAYHHNDSFWQIGKKIISGNTEVPWGAILITLVLIFITTFILLSLSHEYHVLGTDKVGNDVFYEAIKSIRTGLIIGTLTTLIMLPFAVLFGMMAGYFGGKTDDIIQYIYTTLSSIPAVLLITAVILSIQVFIENHPQAFPTIAVRADVRLLALCIILGITSWTQLCRLLRGETLKLRETDFVSAAVALGTKRNKILLQHILPNVMHIILITVVLDFSGLVLAEAVLSYVGVGVDPTTISWGNMINSARLEMAREPIVWWPLLAAFIFMFGLVLSANLFSDAVRDAFDPRLRNVE